MKNPLYAEKVMWHKFPTTNKAVRHYLAYLVVRTLYCIN